MLLSDTVGFVRKLPTALVEAFRSTLEEVAEADLLIHVVDASAADPEAQMEAVHTVLREIGADEVPVLLAFNKSDLAGGEVKRLLDRHPGSVGLAAATGDGVEGLLQAVGERIRLLSRTVVMLVPYERGDVLAALHRQGEVLSEDHEEHGTRVRVRLPDPDVNRFADFLA